MELEFLTAEELLSNPLALSFALMVIVSFVKPYVEDFLGTNGLRLMTWGISFAIVFVLSLSINGQEALRGELIVEYIVNSAQVALYSFGGYEAITFKKDKELED